MFISVKGPMELRLLSMLNTTCMRLFLLVHVQFFHFGNTCYLIG